VESGFPSENATMQSERDRIRNRVGGPPSSA
jgi:hypothetical protein